MVTDPVGTVVVVTDTGDTAPLPPPPDPADVAPVRRAAVPERPSHSAARHAAQ